MSRSSAAEERSRLAGTTAARPWVCLMYHDVTAEREHRHGGPAYFSVSAATFDGHLAMIERSGLRGGSIADVMTRPTGAVAISFDDGDIGQATRAFPALMAHRMTATFFVTTSWIGTARYASWDQLREMQAAGMSIQSHTHSHPFLSELDASALRDELRRSRDVLEERLGRRPNMLALPGGDAPRRDLRPLLAEEGYDVIATSRWGRNSATRVSMPRYVNRCTVRGEPSADAFTAIVTGDSWLSLRKQLRERILGSVRSALGPTRYARWRRRLL